MRRSLLVTMALLMATAGLAQTSEDIARRFAAGFLPYASGATMEAKVDYRGDTDAGPYVAVTVTRSTPNSKNSEPLGLLIDLNAKVMIAGIVMPLPPTNPPITKATLQLYVKNALPQLLQSFLGNKVSVSWPALPTRPSAVIPLVASVETGYGPMKMPMGITSDGAYFAMGAPWPIDRDPRAVRRELLDNPVVQWDPGHDKAVVKVVEFSDFQCPACKHGWGVAKDVFASFGDKLHHGLVNYPLYNNHPWAFKAAVGGRCVGSLWPDKLVGLKEELYKMQDTMSLGTVDPAMYGFLAQQKLPEKPFDDCYMKDAAMDAVLTGMNLGQRLGVTGTPTYYVNGEILPANKQLLTKRIQAIIDAKGLPENAADVLLDPEPTPSPVAAPKPPQPAPVQK
jgi:protein-disulfide isomerase